MARRFIGNAPGCFREAYAWVVAPDGHVRSVPIRAGVEHRYVEYDGNKAKGVDTGGNFPWRIRAEYRDAPSPPLRLIDAYAQDSRESMARRIPWDGEPDHLLELGQKVVPQGYAWYMRHVQDATSGRVERVMSEARQGDTDGRLCRKPYPEDGLPEVAIRRIRERHEPAFTPPAFERIDDGKSRSKRSASASKSAS